VVTTVAGMPRIAGTNDGLGSAAGFNYPNGVAVDIAGNLYVADYSSSTIRKVTPVGTNWLVTTLAGQALSSGWVDRTGSAARFGYTGGVAVDGAGNVYVADVFNQVIRRVTPAGRVTTLAGKPGQDLKADGPGSDAGFWEPFGVAVDAAGNVYVADQKNSRIAKGTPLLQFEASAGDLAVSNGRFQAGLIGPSGSTVVLEASANLATWTSVQTNALPPFGLNVSVPLGTNNHQFFRARLAR
jgi:streptogramin lyase